MRRTTRDTAHCDASVTEVNSPPFASQRRQQVAEALRNKGVICEDFLATDTCPRTPFCPYMHIRNGEVRPLPWSVCAFFNQGVCLRDRCTFFHGTPEQLHALRTQKVKVYRPQDYMAIARPPREFLVDDGNLSTQVTDEQIERARASKSTSNTSNTAAQIAPFAAPRPLPEGQQPGPIYVLPTQVGPRPTVMINAPMQVIPTATYAPVPNYAPLQNYAYMTNNGGLPMIISTTTDANLSNSATLSFGTQASSASFNQYAQLAQPPQPTYHLYRFQ